jgi:hypothetical protein
MNEISALIKETPESSFPVPLNEKPQGEDNNFEQGSGSSPDTKSAGTLILVFPASKSIK